MILAVNKDSLVGSNYDTVSILQNHQIVLKFSIKFTYLVEALYVILYASFSGIYPVSNNMRAFLQVHIEHIRKVPIKKFLLRSDRMAAIEVF